MLRVRSPVKFGRAANATLGNMAAAEAVPAPTIKRLRSIMVHLVAPIPLFAAWTWENSVSRSVFRVNEAHVRRPPAVQQMRGRWRAYLPNPTATVLDKLGLWRPRRPKMC